MLVSAVSTIYHHKSNVIGYFIMSMRSPSHRHEKLSPVVGFYNNVR